MRALHRYSVGLLIMTLAAAAGLLNGSTNSRHLVKLKLLEAEVSEAANEVTKAGATFTEAADLARRHGHLELLWPVLVSLGRLFARQGKISEAKSYFSNESKLML